MLRALFQTIFRKKRAEQELDDELAAYLEQTTAENVRRGMSPEAALQKARRDLGGMERVKENVRAVRVGVSLDILMKDVRYAMRSLGGNPSFTSIAILTIALGIGATTAIYSVVDATLLHPLPYPEPEQLVRIQEDFPGVGAHDVRLSVPEWKDFQSSGIFRYVSPERSGSVNLTGSSQPARIQFKSVSPNYFALLDVKPELGRVFHPDDPTAGFNLEVVISDGLWKRDFGADPHILGRTLRLDNDVNRS